MAKRQNIQNKVKVSRKLKMILGTLLWKRHDLSDIMLKYYNSLKDEFDLTLVACGSEGEISKNLAESNGWNYIEAKNEPLSQKINTLFNSFQIYDFDAAIVVGSDDFLTKEVFKWYENNITAQTTELVGFDRCYFLNWNDKEVRYFTGYKNAINPISVGAGRCFSKYVLERMNYDLWGNEKVNNGLDTTCSNRLRKNEIGERIVNIENIEGAAILDVKHRVNITDYKALYGNTEPRDYDVIVSLFPEVIEACSVLKIPTIVQAGKEYKCEIIHKSIGEVGKIINLEGTTAAALEYKNLVTIL